MNEWTLSAKPKTQDVQSCLTPFQFVIFRNGDSTLVKFYLLVSHDRAEEMSAAI